MNCTSVGYNSCRALGDTYMCASEGGEFVPGNRRCSAPVSEFSFVSASLGALIDTNTAPLSPLISVRFTSTPDYLSLIAHLRLRSAQGIFPVDYEIVGWSNNTVTIRPKHLLSVDTDYDLTIDADLVSSEGTRLGVDQVIAFRTGS